MDTATHFYKSAVPGRPGDISIIHEYDTDDTGHESGTITWEPEGGTSQCVTYSGADESNRILNEVMLPYVSRGFIIDRITDGVNVYP